MHLTGAHHHQVKSTRRQWPGASPEPEQRRTHNPLTLATIHRTSRAAVFASGAIPDFHKDHLMSIGHNQVELPTAKPDVTRNPYKPLRF
jgi:hypothetical protein